MSWHYHLPSSHHACSAEAREQMVTKRGPSSSRGTRGSAQNVQVVFLGAAQIENSTTPLDSPILMTFGSLVNNRMFLPFGRTLGPKRWRERGDCKAEETGDVSWMIRL